MEEEEWEERPWGGWSTQATIPAQDGAGTQGRQARGLVCMHRLVQCRWRVLSGGNETRDISELSLPPR